MKKAIVLVLILALSLATIGCSGDEITFDEMLSLFENLVWEVHENNGVTKERASEILGMENFEDPHFIALRLIPTGIDGTSITIGWPQNRENDDIYSNVYLTIDTDYLNAPLPLSVFDLMPFVLMGENIGNYGFDLDYFEELFGRPGTLTGYVREVFIYRWWADDFSVFVETDANMNVVYFMIEAGEN